MPDSDIKADEIFAAKKALSNSWFSLVVVISVLYILAIPISFIFSFATGVVQSDSGVTIPHWGNQWQLILVLDLVMFIIASTSWAFLKYGLKKTTFILLLLPVCFLAFIVTNEIVYRSNVQTCVAQISGQDQPVTYCQQISKSLYNGELNF